MWQAHKLSLLKHAFSRRNPSKAPPLPKPCGLHLLIDSCIIWKYKRRAGMFLQLCQRLSVRHLKRDILEVKQKNSNKDQLMYLSCSFQYHDRITVFQWEKTKMVVYLIVGFKGTVQILTRGFPENNFGGILLTCRRLISLQKTVLVLK